MMLGTTNAVPLVNKSLVEHYKERLELCERDFEDAVAKIDALKLSHEEHHRLQWRLHRREAEVAELQQALSNAQTQLFDERKQLLRVIAENDDLKVQELKDRKKIRYLLSVTETPNYEITYFREKVDQRLIKISVPPRSESTTVLDDKTKKDITIYEDEVQALNLNILALRTQMDEMRKQYEETVAGLQRDRSTLIEEENIRRNHDSKRIEELEEVCHKVRTVNRENIKELLRAKKALHKAERRLLEENSNLTQSLLEARQQLTAEQKRVDDMETKLEAKYHQANEKQLQSLKSQIQKYENDARQYKQKLEELERSYDKKNNHYQTKIQSLSTSYASLRRRREYEIEGFSNDIVGLRQQLKSLEKYILKYAPMEDRELYLLQLARESGEKAERISNDLQSLKRKISTAEQELRETLI